MYYVYYKLLQHNFIKERFQKIENIHNINIYDENIYPLKKISIKKNIKTTINEIKNKKYAIKNMDIIHY